MPELPEVETVVRDLQKRVVGQKIVGFWTDWPKSIKDPVKQDKFNVSKKAVEYFKKEIIGREILRAKRKGKNILLYLSGEHILLVHQKMTGHLLVGKWQIGKSGAVGITPKAVVEDTYNHRVHHIFELSGGEQLGLSDTRKFAKILFGPNEVIENLPEIKNLGPDAIAPDLSQKQFSKIILQKKKAIKTVLMDPYLIAGIGNIYSDDILWRAFVHPEKLASSLSGEELAKIFKAMKQVLDKAVKLRGTSTSDFRDTFGLEGGYTGHRLVYQRKGEPCGRCKEAIKRIVVGGRSAHFCPKCQK
jgi:formamidopyrimidine-DNA glycosylase